MKNDDFRSPFGVTIIGVSVIFIKFQGGFQLMMVIWSGPFGVTIIDVLVIFAGSPRGRVFFCAGGARDPPGPPGPPGTPKQNSRAFVNASLRDDASLSNRFAFESLR